MKITSWLRGVIWGAAPAPSPRRRRPRRRVCTACTGQTMTRTLSHVLSMTPETAADLLAQGLTAGEIEAIEAGADAMARRHTAAREARAGAAHAERVEAHREALRWDRSHGDDR